MQESPICDQVKSITTTIACNEKMTELLLCAWMMFGTFLEQRGTLPGRLEDISPRELGPFVTHCRSAQTDADALLMTLAALRTLLMRAGHHAGELAALTVPTRRVRMRNASNGKYRYQRQIEEPESRQPHAASDPGDEESPGG
jgi:hypothetical protein